jgi:hypothetical protein
MSRRKNIMRLKKTSDLVHELLINEPACRNSDELLYLFVARVIGQKNGFDVYKMSACEMLLRRKEYGLPSLKSVERARRKLQELNPELCADDTVEAHRMLLEEEYREYAKLYTV